MELSYLSGGFRTKNNMRKAFIFMKMTLSFLCIQIILWKITNFANVHSSYLYIFAVAPFAGSVD